VCANWVALFEGETYRRIDASRMLCIMASVEIFEV
jgi:hypothetical protein